MPALFRRHLPGYVTPMVQRTGLRKREIVFAVAAGAVAAGGAGLILAESGDSPAPVALTAAPQSFELADFDEISTVGPQNLIVTRGDAFAVRSEGDPAALGQLEVVVEDGELIIRPKDRGRANWGRLSGATYFITLPKLESITMEGSGSVQVDRVEGEDFSGAITGSGELAIAAMAVEDMEFLIGGSGNLSVAGTAREAEIVIGGSGEVDAGGLRADSATILIGGSGNVSLSADKEVDVKIGGSGEVSVSGPARCTVARMGSGSVRCEGGGGTPD